MTAVARGSELNLPLHLLSPLSSATSLCSNAGGGNIAESRQPHFWPAALSFFLFFPTRRLSVVSCHPALTQSSSLSVAFPSPFTLFEAWSLLFAKTK